MKSYKGQNIYPADSNSSGMRWMTRTCKGILKADTLAGLKQMISAQQTKTK